MPAVAWGPNERAQLAGGFHGPPERPISCTALDATVRQAVAAYQGFTVALLGDDTLEAVGGGVNGQMGIGDHRSNHYLPVRPHITGVAAIAAAGAHVTALLRDGRVPGWGGNSYGSLGIGTSGEGQEAAGSPIPVYAHGISTAIAIATGGGVAAALLDDFTVRAWGAGSTGALGIGRLLPLKTTEGTTPQLVPGLTGVKAIAVGGFQASGHMLALLHDGTVAQWGAKGPCGTEHDLLTPTLVPGLSHIVAIAAGPGQSFAIDRDGRLFAWGSNTAGQLWLPATVTRQTTPRVVLEHVRAVSAGFQYSYALGDDGRLVAAGRNDQLQLAGDGLENITAIAAGEHHAIALTDGLPIQPPIAASPIEHGLAVGWSSAPQTHKWEVTSRPVGGKWGVPQLLPAGQRSVTITAPTGQLTEVRVRCGTAWPARVAVGIAG